MSPSGNVLPALERSGLFAYLEVLGERQRVGAIRTASVLLGPSETWCVEVVTGSGKNLGRNVCFCMGGDGGAVTEWTACLWMRNSMCISSY